MTSLSICMIVKNEAENLKTLLPKIKLLSEDIIVVDTGSFDESVKIAEEAGCRVFHYEWNDDFSSARNFSISKARGDWVLVLDADEIISERDFQSLKNLIAPSGNADKNDVSGYYLIQRNYTNDVGIAGWRSSEGDFYEESRSASGWWEIPIIRLFRNNQNIKFRGVVHEVVDGSAKSRGSLFLTDIPIHHFGELNKKEGRSGRYIQLLLKKVAEVPEQERFFIFYQLGCDFISQKNLSKAEEFFRKSMELNPDYSKTLLNLGGILLKRDNASRKDLDEAEFFLKRSALEESSEDVHINLGILYSKKGFLNKAVRKFEKAIQMNHNSADAYYNLGLVYGRLNKPKRAEECFSKAESLNPSYANKTSEA